MTILYEYLIEKGWYKEIAKDADDAYFKSLEIITPYIAHAAHTIANESDEEHNYCDELERHVLEWLNR